MKAAVWHGKKDVRVEDIPEPPAPGPKEVKIKVHWCGICGTDLHEYMGGPILIPVGEPHPLTGKKVPPVVLGHEFSGEVVEVGEEVTNTKVGDRVAPNPLIYCRSCFMCRQGYVSLCENLTGFGLGADGAFAEYVNVWADSIHTLLPEIPSDVGALLEPVAVGIHAMRRGNVMTGDTVAIVGAGPIGLITLQAARAAGAKKIISIEKAAMRRNLALELGATEVVDPSETEPIAEVRKLTNDLGVDKAFECVGGRNTAPLAIQLAKVRGKAVIVGVFEDESKLDFNEIVVYERDVVGVWCYVDEFEAALALLADGRISGEPLITGRIKLEDIIEKGFEELIANKESNVKILVSPD